MRVALFIFISCWILSACGNKGELYMPVPEKPTAEAIENSDTKTESKTE